MTTTANDPNAAILRLSDRQDEARRSALGDPLWKRALRHIRRDKLTLAALGILTVIIVLAALAGPITRYVLGTNPTDPAPAIRLLRPGSPGHVLGTDDLGRDYAARLLYGGQISLTIGFLSATITLGIGIFLGLITGYFGGPLDDVMNWIITTLDSIPGLYLLILISTILRPSPETLILVLALTSWTGGVRVIRGQTIGARHQEYILSAKAIGASSWRIMFQHLLPNLLSIILISLSASIGAVIITESTLSYLGLGIVEPVPTWGNMLTNASRFFSNGPHLAIISGLMIFITVLCLYIVGDGLRDAFDPRIA